MLDVCQTKKLAFATQVALQNRAHRNQNLSTAVTSSPVNSVISSSKSSPRIGWFALCPRDNQQIMS